MIGPSAMNQQFVMWSACVIVALTVACGRSQPPASAPATVPATAPAGDDWPAFRGGGAISRIASDLPAPPMKLRWTYVANEKARAAIEGAPVIAGDSVYVADADGIVHAIDLATGKSRWTYEAKDAAFETTPLIVGDKLFVGDLNGVMHAISTKDGSKLWTHDCESPIHSSANSAGDRIIYGAENADVICLGLDGKELWKSASGDRVNSAPAIANGLAYVSGCDGALRAFDIQTGKQKFAADLPALTGGSPCIVGDRAFIGTDTGYIVAMGADGKKKPLWEFDKVEDQQMVYSTPAAADGIVVAGARDRNIYALDANTGQLKWTFATRGDVDSSPVISAGRVYVGSRDKKLYVLDLKTGRKLWEFSAQRGIAGAPAIARGLLVVADGGGAVYCLEGAK
jgi:outer membrane protein assembly factor BamB